MSLVFLYNISIIIYIKTVVICLKVYYIIIIKFSGRSSGVEHNLAKVGVEGSNPSPAPIKNEKLFNFTNSIFCIAITSCTNKVGYQSLELPRVSKKDEEEEIFLQKKKILINEMISASKVLHQISWPILKKNIDICGYKGHIH